MVGYLILKLYFQSMTYSHNMTQNASLLSSPNDAAYTPVLLVKSFTLIIESIILKGNTKLATFFCVRRKRLRLKILAAYIVTYSYIHVVNFFQLSQILVPS